MQNDLPPDAERTLKKFFGIFIGTLFLYVTIYGGCEAYRVRNGAWHLTFDKQPDGTPILRIDQRIAGPDTWRTLPARSQTVLLAETAIAMLEKDQA